MTESKYSCFCQIRYLLRFFFVNNFSRESEERLVIERELRDEKRDKAKLNKYNKNMKQLRMEMRSSLYDRTTKGPHTHEYGEEKYHEDEDNYTHSCTICGFVETFEKM